MANECVENVVDTLLKDSPDLYKTIFENSAVAITLTDENEKIISWNKYAEELLCMRHDELYMQPIESLYPTEEWQKIRSQNVRQKGMQHRLETKILRKDKESLDVDISLSVLKDHNGKIMGSIGVIKDISERKKTERELKISEERYRTVFENSAVAITLTDENEKIISWNKYAEDLLGMGHEDLYMKSVETMYSPEEWQRIRSQNVRQKGMQHHLETKILRKNNDPLDVDISLSIIKNNEGKITGSIGVIKDISEQKQAERRLGSIMEYADDSIYLLDKDCKYLLANKELLTRFNQPEDKIIGKQFSELHSAEETKEFTEKMNWVFENGKPSKDEHYKEGKWYLRSLSPVKDYITGQTSAIAVVSKDITDWKKTEEKLVFEHSLLQDLLDNVPDSFYFKDMDNKFILVNKAKAEHSQKKPEEMIGKSDYDFLSEDQAKRAFDDDNKVKESGVPILDEIEKITGEDGAKRWISVTKMPRYDKEGTIIGTMGISRDVTKLVKGNRETETYKKVAIGQNLRMIELRDRVKDLISEMEK